MEIRSVPRLYSYEVSETCFFWGRCRSKRCPTTLATTHQRFYQRFGVLGRKIAAFFIKMSHSSMARSGTARAWSGQVERAGVVCILGKFRAASKRGKRVGIVTPPYHRPGNIRHVWRQYTCHVVPKCLASARSSTGIRIR